MRYRIQKYDDFNASGGAEVSNISYEKSRGRLCQYAKTDSSCFFLPENYSTQVVKGEKYMLIGNTEFRLRKGDSLRIPKHTVVFTHIPDQTEGFISLNTPYPAKGDSSSCPARMLDTLITHLFEPLTIPELAEKTFMSTATFKRHFSRNFGIAPKTWIRQTRLRATYFYLRTQQYPVSEVAFRAGFDNLPHFSHSFKQQFHLSPSDLSHID
ncbi:AraC family transcriptional regulator [Fulvitalea axinellae]